MRSSVEERTRHFYRWERRGRGHWSFPFPVALEPPFVPFRFLDHAPQVEDDGRHHSALSGFLAGLLGSREVPPPRVPEKIPEPEPEPQKIEERGELLLLPRADRSTSGASAESWLKNLPALQTPASFELLGEGRRVKLIMSAGEGDLPFLSSGLRAFFPALEVEEGEDLLANAWMEDPDAIFSVVEFGLAREFMLPLCETKSVSPDPLTGLIVALSGAESREAALLQILFQGVRASWAESAVRSVTTPSGEPFFADAPELTDLARRKMSAPLFAVAVRAAVLSSSEERVWSLLCSLSAALSNATRGRNELIPLGGADQTGLLRDVLLRATHRSGCILSLPELLTLVHLPDLAVSSIVRESARTKALPPEARGSGVFLGYNRDHGKEYEARLSVEARMRHVHVVGASGSGKSTLLVSMILQDIAHGHGVGVIDPHGDLIDAVLGLIPENRAGDVILFDPADPDYAVGWNILSAHSEPEKEMLASDLVAAFRRLSTSWGDQMTAVLANAILAFLESNEGGTLSELRRFLSDPGFRRSFLATVRDPHVRDFWTTEFPLIMGKPQGSILTRLDTLLRSRLVRGVVTAREKPLDFRAVVDEGRVFLARLSQGAIGEENAALLGSLLVSKIHQVSLLRQDRAEERRKPFFLYLDEFHNLATPSMASLFSGARKYRLGLTVAHQDLYQIRKSVPEVERSVLANAYTRICFQLGEEDARTLGQGFSFFTADDLGNLRVGEAIVRIGRRENDFNLRTVPIEEGDARAAEARRRDIRRRSLLRWGTPRTEDAPRLPEVERSPPAPTPREIPVARIEDKSTPTEPAREAELPGKSSPEPQRPGKGGPEHTYLQELVKRWAEEHGFRAAIEEQIPGTRESIDVALYRGDARIACEISVTTPLEYEVLNVEKCLAAGFGEVAVVSLKKGRLEKLGKLLSGSLPPESFRRVHLFTPEELLVWLSGQPVGEETGMTLGYKVKVRYQNRGDARSKRVAEILAKSMSRLQKEKE
ncbi:MAG TPA: type IV secretion system DNA-binding domain-containing protein [Thermoanaerobaculia bacterium]|nr:type IV secretion system DNA-binding domain-containing protein [Thermoanaerobaculia bacterium]